MFSFSAISMLELPSIVMITIFWACGGKVLIALWINESTSSSSMASCSISCDMKIAMSMAFFCFTRSCFRWSRHALRTLTYRKLFISARTLKEVRFSHTCKNASCTISSAISLSFTKRHVKDLTGR